MMIDFLPCGCKPDTVYSFRQLEDALFNEQTIWFEESETTDKLIGCIECSFGRYNLKSMKNDGEEDCDHTDEWLSFEQAFQKLHSYYESGYSFAVGISNVHLYKGEIITYCHKCFHKKLPNS